MNGLSWLLYLADVAGSFDAAATVVSVFAGFAFAGGTMAHFIGLNPKVYSFEDREEVLGFRNRLKLLGGRFAEWGAVAFVVSGVLCLAVPSRDTIYAIAASELGEQALHSETASKAVQALDAWLDRQIAGAPEPEASQ